MGDITWVIESSAFPPRYARFREAIEGAGHDHREWDDAWWLDGRLPSLSDRAVVFHGSLGNAARIREETRWRPGAYCRAESFRCSAWYPAAGERLLHRRWLLTTVARLAAAPLREVAPLGDPGRVFVRPDSPLKPFAGRVLDLGRIDLAALDYGFYYEDPELPVVVAPVREVASEWRFVVASGRVVAGSAYAGAGREPLPHDPGGSPWGFAAAVAAELPAPEPVYVLDVCEADGRLWLLELNPFSGADLYAADPRAVVEAVTAAAIADFGSGRS